MCVLNVSEIPELGPEETGSSHHHWNHPHLISPFHPPNEAVVTSILYTKKLGSREMWLMYLGTLQLGSGQGLTVLSILALL